MLGFLMFSGGSKGNIGKKRVKQINSDLFPLETADNLRFSDVFIRSD